MKPDNKLENGEYLLFRTESETKLNWRLYKDFIGEKTAWVLLICPESENNEMTTSFSRRNYTALWYSVARSPERQKREACRLCHDSRSLLPSLSLRNEMTVLHKQFWYSFILNPIPIPFRTFCSFFSNKKITIVVDSHSQLRLNNKFGGDV